MAMTVLDGEIDRFVSDDPVLFGAALLGCDTLL
jgi:hypothetical protein